MLERWADRTPLREHVRNGFFWAHCSHFSLESSDQRGTQFSVYALGCVPVRALLTELLGDIMENSTQSTLEHGSMVVASLK
jgi:hypothetical protein